MARYGDLYTPASNYGQVYRGSLASRQKSVEEAGKNMKDFAGEIYNLVDRQRQAKLAQEEQKSLERERASLQNSRKARAEYDKEQQNFQNYISRLNAITKLHNQEQRLIDVKSFPFWGGIENTRKAYKDRVKLFQDAQAAATGNEARMRAVYNNFSDLFPRLAEKNEAGEYVNLRPITKNRDGTGYAVPLSKLEEMNMMSEGTYVESMRDQKMSTTNKYQPGLDATLRHPKYGFGDMLVEVEALRKEVDRSKKVSQSVDNPNAIQSIIKGESGPKTSEQETKGKGSNIFSTIIGEAEAAETGEDIPGEITEEETPGFVYQDLTPEQGEELRSKVASKYKWFNSTSQKRQDGVSQMMAIIGLYLQQMGEEDTPDARIAEFDKMPKTRALLEDVNSTPDAIFNEFKRHSGFKEINKDDRPMFDEMMNDLSSTLRTGLAIFYASPENKYTTKQMVDDGGKVIRYIFGEKQKSSQNRPQRNSSLKD